MSGQRLISAHLPATHPSRRETRSGRCSGCLTRFAVDVRLPAPAGPALAGERPVRVVHPVMGGFVLEPYNPAYTARRVEKTEVEALHVVYPRRREF